MRNKLWVLMVALLIVFLTACGDDNNELEELPMLEVEFEVPETAEVGDTIELKAVVTYDDELVTDADDVNFEFWENDDKDNSVTLDSTNNEDGTYTASLTLENDDTVYTIFAHTTARTLHTMPKRSITVGNPETHDGEAEHEGHGNSEGFSMHFMTPEDAKVSEETQLMVHLQMDEDDFENAEVRYEIWNDDISDKHDWVDTDESSPGEYVAMHKFLEAGTYTIQIHVEDDDGLHEHEEHEVIVSE